MDLETGGKSVAVSMKRRMSECFMTIIVDVVVIAVSSGIALEFVINVVVVVVILV